MSSKPETTFYQSVHRHLPGLDKMYREKMFNPLRGGTWDFWYSGKRDLWVEYKFIVLPKRDSTLVLPELSPLQLEWGKGRVKEGRNLAVIVGCKDGGVIYRDFAWEQPIPMKKFRELLVDRKSVANWLIEEVGV